MIPKDFLDSIGNSARCSADTAGNIAIIAFFLLDHDKPEPVTDKQTDDKETKKDNTIMHALKNKNIWLVSLNIFFVYSVYCGLTYFKTPGFPNR